MFRHHHRQDGHSGAGSFGQDGTIGHHRRHLLRIIRRMAREDRVLLVLAPVREVALVVPVPDPVVGLVVPDQNLAEALAAAVAAVVELAETPEAHREEAARTVPAVAAAGALAEAAEVVALVAAAVAEASVAVAAAAAERAVEAADIDVKKKKRFICGIVSRS